MPWARSVVVCALNYNAERRGRSIRAGGNGLDCALCLERAELATMGPPPPTDYHDELLGRLRLIEAGAAGADRVHHPLLRGYRAAGRAQSGGAGRRGLDRQEYLRD
jgi:hypothetical protein